MSDNQQCAECGMPVEPGEYHPYTACLIFKQTSSSKAVHANLNAVLDDGANRWRSVATDAIESLKDLDYERFIRARSAFDSLRKEQGL